MIYLLLWCLVYAATITADQVGQAEADSCEKNARCLIEDASLSNACIDAYEKRLRQPFKEECQKEVLQMELEEMQLDRAELQLVAKCIRANATGCAGPRFPAEDDYPYPYSIESEGSESYELEEMDEMLNFTGENAWKAPCRAYYEGKCYEQQQDFCNIEDTCFDCVQSLESGVSLSWLPRARKFEAQYEAHQRKYDRLMERPDCAPFLDYGHSGSSSSELYESGEYTTPIYPDYPYPDQEYPTSTDYPLDWDLTPQPGNTGRTPANWNRGRKRRSAKRRR